MVLAAAALEAPRRSCPQLVTRDAREDMIFAAGEPSGCHAVSI